MAVDFLTKIWPLSLTSCWTRYGETMPEHLLLFSSRSPSCWTAPKIDGLAVSAGIRALAALTVREWYVYFIPAKS